MKKNLQVLAVAALGLLAPGAAFAQVVISANDILPQANDSFKIWVNPGPIFTNLPGGTNQTWTTGLPTHTTQTKTVKYQSPGNTPYATNFPGGNLSEKNSDNSFYQYFTVHALGMKDLGSASSGNNAVIYTNPMELMQFPATFNTTFTDNFAGYSVAGTVTTFRKGTVTSVADGYGSFQIPAGGPGSSSPAKTLQNVLRIKSIITYRDSTSTGNLGPTYTKEIHNYYAAGIHYPIFQATRFSDGNNNAYNLSYVDSNTISQLLATTEALMEEPDVVVFPNPASAEITIQYSTSEPTKITLHDLLGKQLAEFHTGPSTNGLQRQKVNIAKYPKGIYLLKLATAENSWTKRLVIE